MLSWLVVKEKPGSHRAVGPTAPRSSFPFSARACRYKYPVALLAPPPFVPLLSHGQIPLVVYSSGAGCVYARAPKLPPCGRPLPAHPRPPEGAPPAPGDSAADLHAGSGAARIGPPARYGPSILP